ncbi:MAG: hypothetical protein KJ607_08500 [Bacteroidetes bacterium]|nr:hypothetical protein [Bacteroidota bacterium]
MKSLYIILLLVFFTVQVWSQEAEEIELAKAYIEKIYEQRIAVSKKNLEYVIESVHGNDGAVLNEKRQQVVRQLDESIAIIDKKMFSHAGDAHLKNQIYKIMEQYREVYGKDYKTALRLRESRENSFDDMKKYLDAVEIAEKKIHTAETQMNRALDEFVEKYNAGFTRDVRLEKLIEDVTGVNEYNRKILLVYFKVINMNKDFTKAFNEKNLASATKAREAMSVGTDSLLLKLEKIGPYKDDNELNSATEKLVKFYKSSAKKTYPDLEYYLQKQRSLVGKDIEKINEITKDFARHAKKVQDDFSAATGKLLQTYIPKKIE